MLNSYNKNTSQDVADILICSFCKTRNIFYARHFHCMNETLRAMFQGLPVRRIGIDWYDTFSSLRERSDLDHHWFRVESNVPRNLGSSWTRSWPDGSLPCYNVAHPGTLVVASVLEKDGWILGWFRYRSASSFPTRSTKMICHPLIFFNVFDYVTSSERLFTMGLFQATMVLHWIRVDLFPE